MNTGRKTQFRPYPHVAYDLVKGTWEINNQFSHKIILWLLDYAVSWRQNQCPRKISWEIILEKPSYLSCQGALWSDSSMCSHQDATLPFHGGRRPCNPTRLAGGDVISGLLAHKHRGHIQLTSTVGQKPIDLFPGLGHCSPGTRCLAPALIPQLPSRVSQVSGQTSI